MNYTQFISLIQTVVNGLSFSNPSGTGNTIIINNNGSTITYQRGSSNFSIDIQELWDVYTHFSGQSISCIDLKNYKPHIYDSNQGGHSCHCTTLFLIFQYIGIITSINGSGVRNNPFWIQL